MDLNVDRDDARALHRIVRAMHDGECPKCHKVYPSAKMRATRWIAPPCWPAGIVPIEDGWQCHGCGFFITDQEAEEVFKIFAPFMENNLAIFEKWRASR